MTSKVTATVPDDLILKIRRIEGWPRVEGDKLSIIQRINDLYDVTTTREGRYVAIRRKQKGAPPHRTSPSRGPDR